MNTDSRKVCARSAFLLVAVLASCTPPETAGPDRELVAYINGIKAIDVHAHPMRYVAEGAARDSEYDALPLDGIPPFSVPIGLRPDYPGYRDAQRTLFGSEVGGRGSEDSVYLRDLHQRRARVMKEKGEHYGEWVLDQAGIDIMLANRIVMGAGLPASRFRWVPFADPLMLPLDTKAEAQRTPDTKALYPLEAKLLQRYLADVHMTKIPATLGAFETQVITPTLEAQKQGGAVGIKFEAAYLRSLAFLPADAAPAQSVYARYANGGTPTHAEYTLLQDHLFRAIAREAGRLGLTIQIHTTDGFGGFYSVEESAARNLESVFNDSTLRGTTFVLVHGGWPRVEATLSLLNKPNVYADVSMMNILAEPIELARAIRLWLGARPEKVLFGTDAFDGGDAQGWEQVAWVGSHNTRLALADALTQMLRYGEISRERAKELAGMVLRENALKAYALKR